MFYSFVQGSRCNCFYGLFDLLIGLVENNGETFSYQKIVLYVDIGEKY